LSEETNGSYPFANRRIRLIGFAHLWVLLYIIHYILNIFTGTNSNLISTSKGNFSSILVVMNTSLQSYYIIQLWQKTSAKNDYYAMHSKEYLSSSTASLEVRNYSGAPHIKLEN
jgi:hypothetical protein